MRIRSTVLALATGAALVPPTVSPAQEATYSGSLQYSTGEYYFTERTNSAYLVNDLSLAFDRLRLTGSIPVIWQSTPWVSYGTGGGVPTGGTQEGEVGDRLGDRDGPRDGTGMDASPGVSQRPPRNLGSAPEFATVRDRRIQLQDTTTYDELGVGDPSFRVEVELTPPGPGAWSVALGGQVKAPLADPDRGFGTGAWDGGVDLSASRRLGTAYLFGTVGYTVLGDMEELELQDPVTYGAGVGYTPPGGSVGLLANVSGSTRILEGTDPPLQVGGGLNVRLAPGRSLGFSVAFGLTESSPDVSLSAGWMVSL